VITNSQSGTRLDEIADGIYRISTPFAAVPGGFSTFACMHGSAWKGDGGGLLRELAKALGAQFAAGQLF